MKPAELLFQMHLLAERSKAMSASDKDRPECSKSSRSWLLLALHLNPSSLRYWEALKQVLKCKRQLFAIHNEEN
jgi:superkiller protein 3